jgi:hypothetical protein
MLFLFVRACGALAAIMKLINSVISDLQIEAIYVCNLMAVFLIKSGGELKTKVGIRRWKQQDHDISFTGNSEHSA